MKDRRSGTGAADTTPRKEKEACATHAVLLTQGTYPERGNSLKCRSIGTTISDHLTASSYLCQPLDRSYRDFLSEHIARLEAERRRLEDQLATLREEWELLNERE